MKNRCMPLPAAVSVPSVDVSPVMMLPFGVLLLLIGFGPPVFPTWWHRHYRKVSLGLGLLPTGYYVLILKNGERLVQVAREYVSFVVLIGSLWVLENCWRAWLVVIGSLLAIFYDMDSMNFRQAPKEVSGRMTRSDSWSFAGWHNLIFVAIIMGAVLGNRHLIFSRWRIF